MLYYYFNKNSAINPSTEFCRIKYWQPASPNAGWVYSTRAGCGD